MRQGHLVKPAGHECFSCCHNALLSAERKDQRLMGPTKLRAAGVLYVLTLHELFRMSRIIVASVRSSSIAGVSHNFFDIQGRTAYTSKHWNRVPIKRGVFPLILAIRPSPGLECIRPANKVVSNAMRQRPGRLILLHGKEGTDGSCQNNCRRTGADCGSCLPLQ